MDRPEIERLFARASDAMADGDFVRAVAIADQLTAELPDDAAAWLLRAESLLASGAEDETLEAARRAVELDAEGGRAHRILGLAAWRCERLSLAQESLQRALELSGHNPELLAEFAWFMASERGPRLAEKTAREAVEANETSSTAWAALGLVEFRLHRREQAEESLRRALTLNPDDVYAQSAMAALLQDQGKDTEAEEFAARMADTPGTEQLVESIREEARQRKLERLLIQRDVVADPAAGLWPRRLAIWLVVFASLIAGIYLVLNPHGPGIVIILFIFPLLLFWCLRQLFR
ncbi:MAG: tetratricopeptide repeat protein [Thermoguttaceae bacterium]